MSGIIAAIIGGIFGLVQIWFKHYLDHRKERTESTNDQMPTDTVQSIHAPPKTVTSRYFSGPKMISFGILLWLAGNFLLFMITPYFEDPSLTFVLFLRNFISLIGGFFFVVGVYKTIRHK